MHVNRIVINEDVKERSVDGNGGVRGRIQKHEN
jgi:hypothetical protein